MMDVSPTFWPRSLNEWLLVGGVVAAAIGAVYQWVRKPIFHKINEVGRRLNEHILEARVLDATFETRASTLERAHELTALNVSNLLERITGIGIEVATIKSMAQENALTNEKQLGGIREALGRIETQVAERTSKKDA